MSHISLFSQEQRAEKSASGSDLTESTFHFQITEEFQGKRNDQYLPEPFVNSIISVTSAY